MRATVSRAEVLAFVRSLGADPDLVADIEFTPHEIKVTTFHLDEQGNRHLVDPPGFRKDGDPPDEVATETTVIRIVGPSEGFVRMRHPGLDREIDVPAEGAGQRAAAGWEVVEAATGELSGGPYVWTGGEAVDDKQPESAPEEPKTPRRRKTSKESDD
jgi:hypothetical protein